MANMSPNKVAMPEQDPNVRNKNFKEVALGYTKEMAMEEATRCLTAKINRVSTDVRSMYRFRNLSKK